MADPTLEGKINLINDQLKKLPGIYASKLQWTQLDMVRAKAISVLSDRIDALEETVMHRIEGIDTEMSLKFDSITSVVNERFNHISYQISQEFQRNNIKEAGGHQLKAGLVTATIAATASVLIFFLSHALDIVNLIKK